MVNKHGQAEKETAATAGQDSSKSSNINMSDMIMVLYFRKVEVNKLPSESSFPVCSVISFNSVLWPCRAWVIDPSGTVLLGMKVQQAEPNIEHTPPLSVRSKSRLILFCTVIGDDEDNCSE